MAIEQASTKDDYRNIDSDDEWIDLSIENRNKHKNTANCKFPKP